MASNRNPLTKAEVIEAAISCIERFGVAKTSMTDVARVLGVTRQTVHRLFETRNELIEAVADVRIEKLAVQLAREFSKFETIEDAIIEGSLLSLAVGRTDSILVEIQEQANHAVDQYMFRGSPKVQSVMLEIWGPVFDSARDTGRLRKGMTSDQAVDWIRNVHAMLNMRNDYNEAQQREMLADFVVPSLLDH
ncbi:TetR/AcrR family transcriptional regulator [Novosphingobium olei]|uniref:TetR/AcrR family transcriptional regulator n=1 Tax=Novosphingobium olei TaxID=2728851 RepID=UPI0030931387|nr:TetR/AcrR family transcriptional regulator [Novosphingobium olei]